MIRRYDKEFDVDQTYVRDESIDPQRFEPGQIISWRDDYLAQGTIIATSHERSPDWIVVLWAVPPFTESIKVESIAIPATSRKLRAKWSVELADD